MDRDTVVSAAKAYSKWSWRNGIKTFFGPAFVAAIAYVDPGNFATNVAAGASSGYVLIWVVTAANLIGLLIQMLSAKLGAATGRGLPELCRDHYSRQVALGLFAQAVIIAMATDLAEIDGAAIALNLLCGVPLIVGGIVAGLLSMVILLLDQNGNRRFEALIAFMLGLILFGFVYETLGIGADWGAVSRGFVPGLIGSNLVLLACGILGATVMPHVIYLHSAMTKYSAEKVEGEERGEALSFLRLDTIVAMTIAGAVNILMLVFAARLFHHPGLTGVNTLAGAHAAIEHLVGGFAALTFTGVLLVSGIASSSVGTQAGQEIMKGFINRPVKAWKWRLFTIIPALLVLASGLNPSRALVLSQVVLSFGIPCALLPLVKLTSMSDVMGSHVNRRVVTVFYRMLAYAIVLLNGFLLWQTFKGWF